ncbi:HEAT repeat domain-containing protein [Thermospira aquatica]|uniref:HEAT repeat domain-containing protein n=1 Tax=Thermospira aquatica TaxID=2828656 RepID=A0AAX3BBM7_9SPIR|nr:HEAT repeat domain-containing protein [Thermospira aquatica]URA09510.1 HEAT repeat domain-containing protein [Thermospira aquatica]
MRNRIVSAFLLLIVGWVFAAHNVTEEYINSLGAESIDQLMVAAALEDPNDVPIKIKAILRLGELKAKEAVPVLIDALGYGSETIIRVGGTRKIYTYQVRLVAAKALAQIGDERAVHALASRAYQDEDPIVKRAAVQALGLMGNKAKDKYVLTVLYDLLDKTPDNALVADICEALGKIGDKSSFVYLLRVTQGPYLNSVKEVAQKSITQIKWNEPNVFETDKSGGGSGTQTPYTK